MPEHWETYVLLCLAALAAGIMNSIAGGGTLLTFPALLAAGISPVVANATSTVALVPGSLSGAWGYRDEFRHLGRWTLLLIVPSLIGGITGALLLRISKDGHKTVWKSEDAMANHYNTCVHHQGYLYGSDGRQERWSA